MSALRAQLTSRPTNPPRALVRSGLGRMNWARLLPNKWKRGEPPRRSAAPPAGARRIPRSLLPCDPIFYHHAAILWTRRPGVLAASRPPPSDDIGRKRETPMNSTSTPKSIEPRDALVARTDERLAHAYEQITRADERLARLSEQVAKMERDAARPPSAGPRPQSPPKRPA